MIVNKNVLSLEFILNSYHFQCVALSVVSLVALPHLLPSRRNDVYNGDIQCPMNLLLYVIELRM